MSDYTRFGKVEASELKGSFNGNLNGDLNGNLNGCAKGVSLSKSANYSLADAEKLFYIGATFTAASKTLTLGLDNNSVCIVANEGGTNAFTLKNVSGDTGTSVAAGKVYLVIASKTANASKLTLLN